MAQGARRTRRKRRTNTKRKRVMTNKELTKQVRMIKSMPEMKYENAYISDVPDGGGEALQCSNVGRGSNVNQRVGYELVAKRLELDVVFENDGAPATGGHVRLIVLCDKQRNGSTGIDLLTTGIGTYNTTALLDNQDVSSFTVYPSQAFMNYATSQRYKVMYDKLLILNPYTTNDLVFHHYKLNFNLHNAKIKYASSEDDGTAIPSKAYIVAFISDSTQTNYRLTINSRFWYIDP